MALSMEELKKVRTITIIALFSDDDLMDTLVLKGGNALEIGYGFNSRASVDVDFSMTQEFKAIGLENEEEIRSKLEKVLTKAFHAENYQVFDVTLKVKPKKLNEKTQDFWGGYEANFKIIEIDKYEQYKEKPTALAAKAVAVNHNKKNISIDFGRFEYCGSVIEKDLNGYEIQIYTPQLMIHEKLRAICQQMPTYLESIGKEAEFGGPRPRDFYDIYTILENDVIKEQQIDFKTEENIHHLEECFKAKRVPLNLLQEIKNVREFHRQAESKLFDAVLDKANYKGFDYYFEYVLKFIDTSLLVPVE